MKSLFLKFEGRTVVINEEELKDLLILNQENLGGFIFTSNSKICSSHSIFEDHQTVNLHCALIGGKGGFGAKLKTEGGKKVRPNENMFSRDLQGRPIAYSNISKEYEQFYKKKLQQDEKVKKQMAEFNVISSTYKEDYVSMKLDHSYNAEMQENQKRIKDAMKIGIKKYLQKKSEENHPFKQQIEKQEQNDKAEEEKSQQEPAKRPRPLAEGQFEDVKEGQKKLKPNEQITQKKQEVVIKKESNIKFASARQKLKSLFKK